MSRSEDNQSVTWFIDGSAFFVDVNPQEETTSHKYLLLEGNF